MAFNRAENNDPFDIVWPDEDPAPPIAVPPWLEEEPAPPIAVSQQLRAGRFRVGRLLGSGGMGEVHWAEDTELHRSVAIKSVRADLCEDPEVRKRIERECLLHARVGPHPNIVTLFDRFDEGGQIRLVMEYVEGETLHARLRSHQALPLEEALRIAVQVLDALARIHSHGIVHRDIKPSNIILYENERGETCAKLMDFGIARQTGDVSVSHITQTSYGSPGTPLYMAPEQIDPQQFGPVSAATDVYAMGIVLYQMVSGAPPFTGTITEVFNAHLNRQPSFEFSADQPVPELVAGLLQQALAKRPAMRHPTAHVFRDELLSLSTEAMLGEAQAGARSMLRVTPGAPQTPTTAVAAPVPHASRTGQQRFVKNRRRSGMVVIAAVTLALLGAWAPIGAYIWSRNAGTEQRRSEVPETRRAAMETHSGSADALPQPPPMEVEAVEPAVPAEPLEPLVQDAPVEPVAARSPEEPQIDAEALEPPAPVTGDLAAPVMDDPAADSADEAPPAPLPAPGPALAADRPAEVPSPPPAPEMVEEPLYPPLPQESVTISRKPSTEEYVRAATAPRVQEESLSASPPPVVEPPDPPYWTPRHNGQPVVVQEPPADRDPIRIVEAAPASPRSAADFGFRVLGSESYRKN